MFSLAILLNNNQASNDFDTFKAPLCELKHKIKQNNISIVDSKYMGTIRGATLW